jgi:integration host factor subunit alpha
VSIFFNNSSKLKVIPHFKTRRIMTLTKADLVRSVIDNIRLEKPQRGSQRLLFPELDYDVFTKRRATEIVDTLFEIIKRNLENGEDVLIPDFGKLKVKFKWARKGRNPQTGEQIILDSRRVVTFHCSAKLREKINKGVRV